MFEKNCSKQGVDRKNLLFQVHLHRTNMLEKEYVHRAFLIYFGFCGQEFLKLMSFELRTINRGKNMVLFSTLHFPTINIQSSVSSCFKYSKN